MRDLDTDGIVCAHCVHFFYTFVHLLHACGYRPNTTVATEIVGAVSSYEDIEIKHENKSFGVFFTFAGSGILGDLTKAYVAKLHGRHFKKKPKHVT